MTLDEILVAIAAFVGGDPDKAKEVAKKMREHADTRDVAQELVQYGAGKKKGQLDGDIATLTRQLETTKQELEELQTAFDDFKAKTPDVAKVEQELTAKHTRKLQEKDAQLAAKDQTLKGALTRGARERLVTLLSTEHKVDPEYAREVMASKYADRFVVGDDGRISVLQPGSTDSYDADTDDAAVALLAAQVAKTAPAKFVNTNADRGAGSRSGQGGGSTQKTAEEVKETKRNSVAGAF